MHQKKSFKNVKTRQTKENGNSVYVVTIKGKGRMQTFAFFYIFCLLSFVLVYSLPFLYKISLSELFIFTSIQVDFISDTLFSYYLNNNTYIGLLRSWYFLSVGCLDSLKFPSPLSLSLSIWNTYSILWLNSSAHKHWEEQQQHQHT